MNNTVPPSIAIIGAGPAGLSLAIFAAQKLPQAKITLYDARPIDADLNIDPRILALSYGSVQFLKRLGVWSPKKAQPIQQVNVSQQQPTLLGKNSQVWISAKEMNVPMLGAVIPYPDVIIPMQDKWLALVSKEPKRLNTSFSNSIKSVKPLECERIEVDGNTVDEYDLVIAAEGGVFSTQDKKTVVSDYKQRAWIGRATLKTPMNGVAYERFTSQGPAALLPLSEHEAALVWCQSIDTDEVAELTPSQRLAVLNTVFTDDVGPITAITKLEHFRLGLNAEKTIVNGRVVKIGNAAQTLHPVAGQGLNLGLRDVYTLVEQLALTTDIDLALKQMSCLRFKDRWGVIATTELLARGFTLGLPMMPGVRNFALSIMQKITPLKKALAKRMLYGWR